jgi:putative ABC transport system permease protein
MIRSYFLLALRNLWRNRGYAAINILGLALGLATSIFIFLYVFNELSFDRFHEKADRTYKVWVSGMMPTGEMHDAVTAGPMAAALLADYPEVEQLVRIRQLGGWLVRSGADRVFTETEKEFMFTDSTFFEVFSFKLLKGDPGSCLREPRSIVLSEEYARKYFGSEDPIGKTLRIEQDTNVSVITGVMQDFPENSHFHCKMLGSLSTYPEDGDMLNWVNQNYHTYIVLREGTDVEAFETSLYDMVIKYVGPIVQQAMGIDLEQFEAAGNSYGYKLIDLRDIHLRSTLRFDLEPPGNPLYVYLFLVAAILILVIAGINFMNLATARSSRRAREVGLRKVVGSNKPQLISQFLTESIVLSLMALVVAVVLVYLLMPGYNKLIRMNLDFNIFSHSWILPLLILFAILIGVLSGTYPAFVLASFRPSAVLSSNKSSGSSKSLLRKLLIVLQFTSTIVILLATVVVSRQLSYMQKSDPGFEKENVLVLHRSDVLGQKIDAFKEEVTAHSNVISTAYSTHIPSGGFWGNAHWLEGRGRDDIFTMAMYRTSYDFEKALDLELVEGRFFSRDMPTDSTAVVVNETALRVLGIEDPLNTRFFQPSFRGYPDEYMPIIGVVKDFHFESMQTEIKPMAIHFMPGNFEGKIIIRLGEGNRKETIAFIQNKWEEITAEQPFEYTWLDEELGKMYDDERKTGQLLSVFSILSIIVTCLGLLGLISYATSQRTKEIGVRKIMGASIQLVMKLLARETAFLLGISALISIPAFFGVSAWLQNFAYHLDFNWGIYFTILLLVALFVLILAVITVSFHSYRAATANPVESLRYE